MKLINYKTRLHTLHIGNVLRVVGYTYYTYFIITLWRGRYNRNPLIKYCNSQQRPSDNIVICSGNGAMNRINRKYKKIAKKNFCDMKDNVGRWFYDVSIIVTTYSFYFVIFMSSRRKITFTEMSPYVKHYVTFTRQWCSTNVIYACITRVINKNYILVRKMTWVSEWN